MLFGDVDPGGRLPATFPRSEDDLPTAGDPEKYPGVGERVTYKEGVLVGYRWFDANGLQPAYPFGFGLSYTRFAYRGLRVTPGPDGATVTVNVTNTGSRAGTDVPQLYVGNPTPGEPPRQLKGFQRVTLSPGQTTTARFTLDQRSLSYWDVPANAWKVTPGCYDITVARSSRDPVLGGYLAQGGASCPKYTLLAKKRKRAKKHHAKKRHHRRHHHRRR